MDTIELYSEMDTFSLKKSFFHSFSSFDRTLLSKKRQHQKAVFFNTSFNSGKGENQSRFSSMGNNHYLSCLSSVYSFFKSIVVMNDSPKVEIDLKKSEVNNNEFSGDIKPGVQAVVIPTHHDIEEKPASPQALPEYDVTITNTEVIVVVNFKCSLLLPLLRV